MYSYIIGTLEEIRTDYIVVENHGIGYQIRVPERMLSELPGRGELVKIYTHLHVREDEMSLFGFFRQDELELFELLITVSGIGPRGGLSILSVLSPDDLRFAVLSEDERAIAKAPGVGNKTAKRLIIELKDKISIADAAVGTERPQAGDRRSAAAPTARAEAVEALTALGYSPSDAAKATAGIEITENMSTEDVLRAALKQLAF